jgi:hypothetical protein
MHEILNLANFGLSKSNGKHDNYSIPAQRYDLRWWRELRVSETPTLAPKKQAIQKQ